MYQWGTNTLSVLFISTLPVGYYYYTSGEVLVYQSGVLLWYHCMLYHCGHLYGVCISVEYGVCSVDCAECSMQCAVCSVPTPYSVWMCSHPPPMGPRSFWSCSFWVWHQNRRSGTGRGPASFSWASTGSILQEAECGCQRPTVRDSQDLTQVIAAPALGARKHTQVHKYLDTILKGSTS